MIVKILTSAKNFEGIHYSERKNDHGKSELLKAENFGALGHQLEEVRKVDYVNYMKLVCDANPRVKNRQFHAVISTKGKLHSPEELARIAEHYLKEMGYGDNPYLIYHHSDTANNHVHMVSTRVDKHGNKVDDTYEKIRSQKILQKILQQEPKQEAATSLNNALAFNFSTNAQFKLLLEQEGFKVTESEGYLHLVKYGTKQEQLKAQTLQQKLANYQEPSKRISQLKAIFNKYKPGRSPEQFMDEMHRKFSMKFLLHRHSEHDKPYGYTIIDYPKKEVLKGSQVLPLRWLLLPASEKERIDQLNQLIQKTDFTKTSYQNMKRALWEIGFQLDAQGGITTAEKQKEIGRIQDSDLQQLRYNGRMFVAKQYQAESAQENEVLSRIFNIVDIPDSGKYKLSSERNEFLKNLLTSLDQAKDPNQLLKEQKLQLVKFWSEYFLLDHQERSVISIDNLLPDQKLDLSGIDIKELDQSFKPEITQNASQLHLKDIAQLFDLPAEQDGNRRKARKKNRNQQV